MEHHEGFLEDLKGRLENWDPNQTIGDWFIQSVSYFPRDLYSQQRKMTQPYVAKYKKILDGQTDIYSE